MLITDMNGLDPTKTRFSLRTLQHELFTQLPQVWRARHLIRPGFSGPEQLPGSARLAIQLRLARVLGCPVCVKAFPPLARRLGWDETAVQSALAGEQAGLTDLQYGGVVWAGEILTGDGQPPAPLPEPALVLSEAQRQHLLVVMRAELVVHATGLLFLPHAWIEGARH